MADNTAKNVAIAGGALALVGGIFAALSGKKSTPTIKGTNNLGGPASAPRIRKGGCNCGR